MLRKGPIYIGLLLFYIRDMGQTFSNDDDQGEKVKREDSFRRQRAPSVAPGSETTFEPTVYTYRGIKLKAGFAHLESKMSAISEAPKFRKWLDDFKLDQILLKEFVVTDADFFGAVVPARLGFIKGYGVACDPQTGVEIPAIAFIRGDAVAVLIVVRVQETGKKYVLLCKQLRFPAGRALIEACAGMVDDNSGNVVGVAFNEIKEETGFIINVSQLIKLGAIRPSPGGCDEMIHLFAWETTITEAEFKEKSDKIYGVDEHEKIHLMFEDFDTFDAYVDTLEDAKAECCWRRYLKHPDRKLKN